MNTILHQGNNAEVLRQYPDSHFDAIITDPPYGIEFLGKAWDNHTGAIETWQECLRVLKPGGHLLAFSAARTYHNLATNIESVGFEIRDQLMWIYSSGFPKAQDVGKSIERRQGRRANANTGDKWENASGKNSTGVNTTTCRTCERNNVIIGHQFHCDNSLCDMRERLKPAQNQWAGWKTALKPGHEPIVMARKPMKGSTIDCVLEHGVGALNIDATRIPFQDAKDYKSSLGFNSKYAGIVGDGGPLFQGQDAADRKKDIPQAGKRTASFSFGHIEPQSGGDGSPEFEANPKGRYPSNVMGDILDYQKYFYCPKVSRRERHVGFEQSHIPTNSNGMMSRDAQGQLVNNYTANKPSVGNNHPTVKPVALMRYLIQLVTPKNSIVLDPFMGSGSTGMAACELGHTFVGIDLDPAYVEIAQKRIEGWCKTEDSLNSTFDELFD